MLGDLVDPGRARPRGTSARRGVLADRVGDHADRVGRLDEAERRCPLAYHDCRPRLRTACHAAGCSSARAAPARARAPARRGRRARATRSSTAAPSNASSAGSPAAQRRAQLVPLERRRDRRPLARAQRVHADRRLVRVVLAVVDQHLAGAQRLASCARPRARARPARRAARPPRAKRLRLLVGRRAGASGTYTCRPFEPDVFGKLRRPSRSNAPASHSATRQHSMIVAGGPGSRSKTTAVGRSSAGARCSGTCSSSAARLASQTSVGRSSTTREVDRARGARWAPRRRAPSPGGALGDCFSKNALPSTPSGIAGHGQRPVGEVRRAAPARSARSSRSPRAW